MNILVINLDKAIFKENSASCKRLLEYSELVDKIFVIVFTREKHNPIEISDKLFIYPTNSKFKILYYLDSFFIFRKILKKNKIDLIFTQDPFETGFIGFIFAKIYKMPFQIQAHTDFLSDYFSAESFANKIRVFLAKFLIPRANCVRVVSKRIRDSIKIKIKNLKVNPIILPIFVDVNYIARKAVGVDLRKKYPQFDFIILMASRLSREKNISLALSVFSEVVKKHKNAGLIIVGDGSEKENLKKLAREHMLEKNIVLENWIGQDDLISYYKTADLFLLTSNYEGYGMSVVEAMASGCPVLMTDVSLAGEILINKKDGLVVSVGDKERLRDAILCLIYDPNLRQNLAKNAKITVSFFKSKKEYLQDYLSLFLSCVNNYKSGGKNFD